MNLDQIKKEISELTDREVQEKLLLKFTQVHFLLIDSDKKLKQISSGVKMVLALIVAVILFSIILSLSLMRNIT